MKQPVSIEEVLKSLECGWEKPCQTLGYTPLNEEKCNYAIIRVCPQRQRFEKHLAEYFRKGADAL